MGEWEPCDEAVEAADREWYLPNPATIANVSDVEKFIAQRKVVMRGCIKKAVAADPLLRTAADLRAALIEAQAALNGAPNTQGLHSQIEAALRVSDRGAGHE